MNIAIITDNKIQYSYKGCDLTIFKSDDDVSTKDLVSFDAAFLVEPVKSIAVKKWTGHPHIRFLTSPEKLDDEIEYLFKSVECEIKLLIKMPSAQMLKKYSAFKSDIEQVYLIGEDGTHRIRKRVMGDVVSFVETIKIRISQSFSKEYENRIDEYEYNKLLKKADPLKHPIIKSRYCFFYEKQYFELDVYDFWDEVATLELELKSIDEKYSLPPEIEVIKDVTNDKNYKNNNLAGIKYEDYKTYLL